MKTLHKQIANRCIHFNGIMEKFCKAGIKYEVVRVDEGDGPYKWPCLNQGGECPMAEFPTEEQVKAKVEKIEGHSERVITAIISINKHFKETGERSGKIQCECGGKLHYSVAKLNGHVHAKCDSCDISFME